MASIFDYDNYRDYLRDVLAQKSRKNPAFSLRAFARVISVSPGHLSRTLRGQKRLSAESVRQISTALNHTNHEMDRFLSLVELEATTDPEKKALVLRRLSRTPQRAAKVLALETFRVIADWYHFAILALTDTRRFQLDSHWVAYRLGIKPLEARLAIERLTGMGLLIPTGRGGAKVSEEMALTTSDDVTEAAIQENHRQHLELAARALKEVSVELREFNNFTVSVNLKDIPKAKQLIRDFVERFNREMEVKQGQEVYQLNVQLYPLTRIEEKGNA